MLCASVTFQRSTRGCYGRLTELGGAAETGAPPIDLPTEHGKRRHGFRQETRHRGPPRTPPYSLPIPTTRSSRRRGCPSGGARSRERERRAACGGSKWRWSRSVYVGSWRGPRRFRQRVPLYRPNSGGAPGCRLHASSDCRPPRITRTAGGALHLVARLSIVAMKMASGCARLHHDRLRGRKTRRALRAGWASTAPKAAPPTASSRGVRPSSTFQVLVVRFARRGTIRRTGFPLQPLA